MAVVDYLSSGHLALIGEVTHVNIDVRSPSAVVALRDVIRQYDVDSLIHFAARIERLRVDGEPRVLLRAKHCVLLDLLAAARDTTVSRFVFYYSAAVYSDARGLVLEDDPTVPTSPCRDTKPMSETILNRVSTASALKVASLPYFVVDLAEVHLAASDYLAALDYLAATDQAISVFNIGTGRGYSVKEVIDFERATTGFDPEPIIAPRRAGDPAQIVADVTRAGEVLNWEARLGLTDMVSSAWAAS